MSRRTSNLLGGLAFLGLASSAHAEHLRLPEPRTLCKPDPDGTPSPICRDLAPGRYLDEPTWLVLDAEVKRLQDAETRLTAENQSLRVSASQVNWQPGWRVLAVSIVVGFTGGVFVYRHFAE